MKKETKEIKIETLIYSAKEWKKKMAEDSRAKRESEENAKYE
jgi:hypothetical protein